MKKGEIYAIRIGTLYRPAHKSLHGKYILAWCDGPTGKSSGESLYRFAVGDALFDTQPTLADVDETALARLGLTGSTCS